MAQLTVTMTVSIQCLGPEPDDNWGAYNWNAFVWGDGTGTVPKIVVRQLPSQSITPTAAKNFILTRLLSAQSVTPSDALARTIVIGLPNESISATDALAHLYVQDPEGYTRVYPEQVTDFALSTTPDWLSASSTPVSWSSQTVNATPWS